MLQAPPFDLHPSIADEQSMLKFLKKLFGEPPSSSGNTHLRKAGLRHNEEHFQQLVAGVRDYAIFLLDAQGNVRTWNAGAERIKGYRPEEIIGQHFSRFYTGDSASSGWPNHELSVAAATGRFEDEGWRVRKDGRKFWANVVITALRDADGELTGYLKITRDLTDRRQGEEKLRLSEERFRLLVEGVTDYAIFMLDPEGRIVTWNAGAQRLKGYAADEIVGQHFSRFYPAEAVARGWPAEELRRAASEGRVEDEGWRVRKDGTKFWANVVITALRDENGALLGFAKLTRDLTERRRAEESARRLLQEEAARKAAQELAQQIEQQREQLHVTLASIGDAVIVADAAGTITFLNPVAAKLTGWELEEAAGQPLAQVFRIINEKSRVTAENPVSRVFREGTVVGLANHTALLSRGGREIPIEDTAAPIRGADGIIAGAVLVFRDVTEARRAIDARLRLAAIVESSDDAIIGASLDGRVTSWNRGAERLYGYTAGEIVAKPLSLLAVPGRADELPAIMQRIKSGEYIDHYETERVRKDGSRIEVSLTISPIKDSYGEIVGASKIARDITARKEEERRKDEFLALLSHELRNPLAPLRNGLQIMRLAGEDREAAEQSRAIMERQLQHLVRLVDDLLDVSRISRGKLQLRKERISLAAVVGHALEVCGQTTKDQDRRLTVKLPDEPIYLDADKTRLAQALCNLLNNAVKYSDRGAAISLSVERDGNQAVIRVKDAGIGIPAAMLPRVFDMFTQVDRSLEKSQGGLGVGLSIVKRLVEMHGGAVEAHSAGHGMGSEFVIRLPVVPAAQDRRAEAGGQQGRGAARRRILVVDDNIDAAGTLEMMLKFMGNEVRTAHDGLEGLEAAAAFAPEAILMDIGMPELNGYEACRRMRQEPWGKNIVIVALTGWGQDEDKRRSREAGFNGHLVKPVEPAAIEKLLASLEPERV
ncbi:MAG TPA: PAS domain S-box protein [Pirellulales bacterium]|nr:PAS domain S-box protein [Pirellulales bacterium]